ncbi:unnamed protein product [Gongylonema pulchrum]|uniref:Serpin domain-containing protein n=1 Tax=Gongylonema pulchrum TaxID=637853 RepID=A0A3P7NYP9_9BILA|nr:unnamed protein product [Gongylonema pulchrum]
MLAELSGGDEAYELSVANKLFIRDGLDLLESFLHLINTTYEGQLQQVNFVESEEAAKKINDWVMEKTKSKIRNLVNSKMLTEATKMIIVSAIYFKGSWKKPFPERRTEKKPFYLSENEQTEVDTMHILDHFPYNADENVQILILPYRGEHLSMCLLLPKEKYGLEEFENSLNGTRLLEMVAEAESRDVRNLGITDAFEGSANFSGMSDAPLFVDSAVHQAFVEVTCLLLSFICKLITFDRIRSRFQKFFNNF